MSNNGRDPEKDALKAHWKTSGHTALVIEAIRLCARLESGENYSAAQLETHGHALNFPDKYVPDDRTIDRLLNNQNTVRSEFHVAGLMLIAASILRTVKQPSDAVNETLARLRVTVAEMQQAVGPHLKCAIPNGILYTDIATHVRTGATQSSVPSEAVPDVLGMIQRFLKIPKGAFAKMAREFFPQIDMKKLPEASLEQYYNCYRFHAKAGRIVQTFTVVKSPIKERPFCMFSNFFATRDPEKPRRSDGLIIPARDYLYFIGGLESTIGLKIMVVERNPHGDRKLYHGLTITFDENEAMIAARLLLVPTNAKNHVEAGAGIHLVENAPEEIREDIGDIRNRMKFTLESKIYYEGKEISQRQMVQKVGQLLGAPDNLRLTGEDGNEFNPAEDAYYTFNAALTTAHEK